ncbi:MAG TPA: hypothetical protein VIN08_24600 [Ohtaekwangia sp.]|uniref:hypothetical protein n=1 Tax=Ohtaekwangia sp. TaxID=2066019 RepID=UPI002F91EA9A
MKNILAVVLMLVVSHAFSQTQFTGANECRIRILTDKRDYEFVSMRLEAKLNDALQRFEFMIPETSIRSLRDSADMNFMRKMMAGASTIVLNAALPGQIDFAFLKTKSSTDLPGELRIGTYRFEDEVTFGGSMPVDRLYFNVQLYLREGSKYLASINDEHVLEIEVAARGDRMVGLTSN